MKYLLLFSTVLLLSFASAEKLEWKLEEEMTLQIHNSGTTLIFIDSLPYATNQEEDITRLTITSEKGKNIITGELRTFESTKGTVLQLIKSVPYRFEMKSSGECITETNAIYPDIRGVPSFPVKSLSPGDSWTAPAEFIYSTIKPPYRFVTNVNYTWLSNISYFGTNLAVISVSFSLSADQDGGAEDITSFFAESRGTLWWDIELGLPNAQTEKISLVMMYGSGTQHNVLRDFVSRVDAVHPVKSRDMKKSAKNLENAGGKGIEIERSDSGIKVTFADVLFDHNSDRLTDAALEAIKRMAPELTKLSRCEFRLEGHADATGSASYNQSLSLRRAQRTAEALLTEVPQVKDRIFCEGLGSKFPAADNITEEGRKKNRRVVLNIRQAGDADVK